MLRVRCQALTILFLILCLIDVYHSLTGDQAEAFAEENSGDEGSADQTQLKQVGAVDSLSSEPDSLYCDAPPESLHDTNSCSSTESSSTAACDLPESEPLRAAQPASGPAAEALSALMGKRDPCTDCISTDTRTVGQTSSVYSSPDLQHHLQKGSSSDLHTDGGERGVLQADCTDEIFVILNRDTLVQDDQDPEVHVVESLPCLDLLESAQQSGVMPGIHLHLHWYRLPPHRPPPPNPKLYLFVRMPVLVVMSN